MISTGDHIITYTTDLPRVLEFRQVPLAIAPKEVLVACERRVLQVEHPSYAIECRPARPLDLRFKHRLNVVAQCRGAVPSEMGAHECAELVRRCGVHRPEAMLTVH